LVKLSEKLGRRRTFYLSSSFVILGLVCQSLSKLCHSYEMLGLGRFITGVGCGLALPLEGMYFNEISPLKSRGFFCGMTGIFVELGFIVGGVLALPEVLGTVDRWPWMLAIQIPPCLVLLAILPFLHESPRYLLSRKKIDACKRSLKFFGHKDVDAGFKEIEAELQNQEKESGWKEVWQKVHLRRATFLSALVVITAMSSGIIAIDYYCTNILMDVGLSISIAQYASVGIFAQSVLSAILGSFLVDKVGRRVLLLVTTFSLIVSNLALMVSTIVYGIYQAVWIGYLSVAAAVAITFTFGIGPAVLQWIVTSEMVPQNARSKVQLIVMLVQKMTSVVAGLAFFPLQGLVGPYAFLLFIIPLCIVFVIFVIKFPETKRKTVVEVMRELGYKEMEKEYVKF